MTAEVWLCAGHLQGAAKAYTTTPTAGWLWWCYNENSGEVGVLVEVFIIIDHMHRYEPLL
jgi:hypothetical protein